MANNASKQQNTKTREKQITYTVPPRATGTLTVMEEPLEYTVSCPVCKKRAFDISELPETPINVRLKCPHCHRIVQTPLMPAPHG